jgi:hypothetical protein
MLKVARLEEFAAHIWKVGRRNRSPHDYIALADEAVASGDRRLAEFFINLAQEGFDRASRSGPRSESSSSSTIDFTGKK